MWFRQFDILRTSVGGGNVPVNRSLVSFGVLGAEILAFGLDYNLEPVELRVNVFLVTKIRKDKSMIT